MSASNPDKTSFYFDSRLIDPAPARAVMPSDGGVLHTGKRMKFPVQQAIEQPVAVEFDKDKGLTPDFRLIFLELIRDGETLHSVSLMPGYPTRAYLRKWIREDKAFEIEYLVACRERADARADAIDDLSRKMANGEMDPDVGREIAKNHRWLASKENAKRYGDKLETAINHTVRVAPSRKGIDWAVFEDATTIDNQPDSEG